MEKKLDEDIKDSKKDIFDSEKDFEKFFDLDFKKDDFFFKSDDFDLDLSLDLDDLFKDVKVIEGGLLSDVEKMYENFDWKVVGIE